MFRTSITLAAVALAAAPVAAQVTTELDRPTFEAGLTNPLTVTFDGVPDTTYTAAEALAGIDLGFFTVTSQSLSGFDDDVDITNEILQIFPDNAFGGSPAFTFTTDAPVTAFGADFGVPLAVNGDTPVVIDGVSTTFASAGLVSSGFLGFTSVNPFTEITFGPGFDNLSLDNLTFDVVPEPTTLTLFGLAGLGALRRRRG